MFIEQFLQTGSFICFHVVIHFLRCALLSFLILPMRKLRHGEFKYFVQGSRNKVVELGFGCI